MRAAVRTWGGALISAGARRARVRGVGARPPRQRLLRRPPAAQMRLAKVKLLAMLVTVPLVKLAMLRLRVPRNMMPG